MLFPIPRFGPPAHESHTDSLRGFIEGDFLPPRETPMPIDHRRFLQTVAILGAVSAYATIIVGGTVRGMPGAGMSCPDWPLCNGSIVPNLANALILIEYVHRLVAALTGLFMLSTPVAPGRGFRPGMRTVTPSALGSATAAPQ